MMGLPMDVWMSRLAESDIPAYMHEGLARYLAHGIRPGSFLTAVLSNDLREACARADDTNRHHLFNYVFWLYNKAPIGSWGSEQAVTSWLQKHSEARAVEDPDKTFASPVPNEIDK